MAKVPELVGAYGAYKLWKVGKRFCDESHLFSNVDMLVAVVQSGLSVDMCHVKLLNGGSSSLPSFLAVERTPCRAGARAEGIALLLELHLG